MGPDAVSLVIYGVMTRENGAGDWICACIYSRYFTWILDRMVQDR